MSLPARYQALAARCDPLLAQMGMPQPQREEYLADLIGLIGQILDGYLRDLADPSDTTRNDPSL